MPDVGRVAGYRGWSNRDLLEFVMLRARRPLWWLLVAAAGSAAVTTALTLRHAGHPSAEAVLEAELIAGLSLAAAFWRRRRPAGRFDRCLIAFAVTTAVALLQAADSGALYAAGVAGHIALVPVAAFCVLAFPSGQLHGRRRQALVGFAACAAVLVSLPAVLVSPSVEVGPPLEACSPTCPANALQVATVPAGVVDGLRWLAGAAAAFTAIGVAVALVGRFAAGSLPERRTMAAVVAVGGSGAAMFAVRWAAGVAGGSTALLDALGWAGAVLLALLPAAFVAHLIRAQLGARSALAGLLAKLADRPDLGRWEQDVGGALGDPGLRLALWSAADQAYLGIGGAPLGDPAGRLEWHRIDSDGARVAAILHDPELEADPELLRAASTATLLSLEGQRLAREVRATRSRVLAAGEEERRRLERNLHDGAQQHLIALRVKVALIGEVDRERATQVVAELAEDVDATLEELRELAQGIYPPLLRAEGLVGALHAVARRSSIPAAVHTTGVGRYPAAVESAIYFCCLEALQNAGKHAGAAARATIRVSAADRALRFRVEDTGAGYDARAARPGVGIANMAERMAAVDGHVRIVSQPQRGTAVSGWVPIPRERVSAGGGASSRPAPSP